MREKGLRSLEVAIRVSFYNPKSKEVGVFGKGIAQLLEGIERLGSLNASAKSIHMAYSKAWRIMKETEASFGFQLILRDGARGSSLTPKGAKLLKIYQELTQKGSDSARQLFLEAIA
jgi:molybdate transport system regulatory protein